MSMGTKFNENVAVDLKAWDGDYFLFEVEVATRFCQAAMIHIRRPESIIHGLFSRWISLFGAPRQLLSKNGVEFNNYKVKTVADYFGIKLVCNAAE